MLEMINRIKHRGPDETQIRHFQNGDYSISMAFHRLAIVDTTHNAMQPFEHDGIFVLVNGEIWNSSELREQFTHYKFQSNSDCEVILPLFLNGMSVQQICQTLDGEYAFVIYDSKKQQIHIATDELSVRPLFISTGPNEIGIASESKAFMNHNEIHIQKRSETKIVRIPGGSYTHIDLNNIASPVFESYMNWNPPATGPADIVELRALLENSVRKKLANINREYAFLLSGGFDSSTVVSMAQKILRETDPLSRIKTFTIGIVPDPNCIQDLPEDIVAARKVATYLNTDHHELYFSMQEAFDAIPDVVYTAETWDQTTIRASTPMYLGVREIKRRYPQVAVIFSGEVADELFQGYLYNHMAPTPLAGFDDSKRLLKDIHNFDGLRADRMVARWGCELRLPFFDKHLLTWKLRQDPKHFDPSNNNNIEKYILRKACDDVLPHSIAWRTKQALSDASSHKSTWKDFIKNHTPDENKYYQQIFSNTYMGYWNLIPYKWMPPKEWIDAIDSSAATLVIPGLVFNQ